MEAARALSRSSSSTARSKVTTRAPEGESPGPAKRTDPDRAASSTLVEGVKEGVRPRAAESPSRDESGRRVIFQSRIARRARVMGGSIRRGDRAPDELAQIQLERVDLPLQVGLARLRHRHARPYVSV